MHVVVYMAIIHMRILSYPICDKCGKLKKLSEANNRLRILRHLNWQCSQILSLIEDFVAAQPQPSQAAHLPQPSGPSDYQILIINSNEVNPSHINL